MAKHTAALTSTLLLVLLMTLFSGSALAGNGNGNGQASAASEPASQGTAPGNSANAPGQAKKDTATTSANGGGSASQNSASVNGIKPTNATSKGTHCSTGGGTGSSATCTPTNGNAAVAAGAGNGDASKRYGNGTTAAQIANSRGAPAGTDVYGPGNSQPHKVACPGSTKYRDVHAVKNYSRCAAAAGPAPTGGVKPTAKPTAKPTVTPTVTPAGVPTKPAVAVSVAGGVKGAAATAAAPSGAAPQGGVLGVTTSAGKSESAGGVLGAIEAVGGGVLPFTGFPLWAALLVGIGLVASGLALRRQARATV
jgi:hypothetical protein